MHVHILNSGIEFVRRHSSLPLVISFVALGISVRGYRRKSGIRIRGAFTFCGDSACSDRYVSDLILENLRDRAAVIFAIYLQIEPNIYIKLEDHDENPLLLRPYEAYRKSFGPIEFYASNNSRVNINSQIADQKITKRLVLSTSDGKYKPLRFRRRWSPVTDFFRNYLTALLEIERVYHRDAKIGSNTAYVVDFISADGTIDSVPLKKSDYQLKTFRDFSLPEKSLESSDSLRSFLEEQMALGSLRATSFKVIDVEAARPSAFSFYKEGRQTLEHIGFWKYNVLGRLATWLQNREMDKRNKRATQDAH